MYSVKHQYIAMDGKVFQRQPNPKVMTLLVIGESNNVVILTDPLMELLARNPINS